jgi:hypothetical protein
VTLRSTEPLTAMSTRRPVRRAGNFFFRRAPQQKLRTHRSLKAYCATLWWRYKFFFIFPSNGAPVEWNWQGETEVLGGKTCPSATLSTTNPTWTGLWSNPGLRGERSATNRLSHGTALWQPYHLHVPTVYKSVSLNLLEPWGSVQACNGVALPLPYLSTELPLAWLLRPIPLLQPNILIVKSFPRNSNFYVTTNPTCSSHIYPCRPRAARLLPNTCPNTF